MEKPACSRSNLKEYKLKAWIMAHGEMNEMSKGVVEFSKEIVVQIFGDEAEVVEKLSRNEIIDRKSSKKVRREGNS